MQHLLHRGVLLLQIVHVVGGHQFYAVLARQPHEAGQNEFLVADIVVLYLDVKVLAEQRLEPLDVPVRLLVLVGQKRLRNDAGQTRGQTDQPLGVLFEQFEVDARLVIQSLGVRQRHHLDEILVPRLVLA